MAYNTNMKTNRTISQYQKNNQRQMIIIVLGVILIVVLIYNFLFWFYIDARRNEAINHTNENLIRVLKTVDNSFDIIAENEELNNCIIKYFEGDCGSNEVLFAFNNTPSAFNGEMKLIIFDANENKVIDNVKNREVTESYNLALSILRDDQAMRILYINQKQVYLMRVVPLIKNNQLLGKMVMLVDNETFSQHISIQPSHYSIINNSKTSFVYSDAIYLQGYLGRLKYQEIIGNHEYTVKETQYNENIGVVSFSLVENQNQTFYLGSILIVVVGGLILIAFGFISRRVVSLSSENINQLSLQMNALMAGNIEHLDINSNDEIQDIAMQINELVQSINRIHHNNVALLEIAHEAEIKQLIAQFNPHFLYNTLETIRATMTYDQSIASELMVLLNKVLRYSLNSENVMSLEEDLKYIRDYLRILEIRFDQRLSYTIDIKNVDVTTVIPKLLLQPFIENSVKYGFKHQKNLKLDIKIESIDQNIVIEITDDGPGISDEAIASIGVAKGHGLYNSIRRIQLLNPLNQVEIKKIGVKGTQVRITIRRTHV